MHRLPLPGTILLLALFAGGLTGCVAHGAGVYYPSERVVRRPAPPAPPVYRQAQRDASRYVSATHRYVGLSPHQQRQIQALLADRASYLLDRTPPPDRRYIYPFPRRVDDRNRTVHRWWRQADRDIERLLDRRQRRAYRDFARSFDRPPPRHTRGRR